MLAETVDMPKPQLNRIIVQFAPHQAEYLRARQAEFPGGISELIRRLVDQEIERRPLPPPTDTLKP
ncbi:MAG TPA: hypothetical protein VD930_09770 [Gemmatimonadales bacterium]|nr:hypothetical protein [Gemmatimonadales bacterium]